MKHLLVLTSLLLLIGCSGTAPRTGEVPPGQLEAANEEIDSLRDKLAKERALRAITELKHVGKLSGESERLLNALLNSSRIVDQAQGSAVLVEVVKRDPSYLPTAIKRVRELQKKSGDPEFWKAIESELSKISQDSSER